MGLSKLGQAALDYATKEGLYVFPIVPLQKKPPLIKDQYNNSSKDPEQITAWWSSTPNANIGLDCGKSGIVAIDVDSEAGHGKDHAGVGAPLAGLMLVSGGRSAWATRITNTPTGGEHYLFLASENTGEVKTSSNNFGIPGIDARSKGGYVLLPPSKIDTSFGTNFYEFSDPACSFLPVPRKLLSPPGAVYVNEQGETPFQATLNSGDKIKAGGRDNFLIAYAGKFLDYGLNKQELRALIEAAYYSRCEDGDKPFNADDFDRLTTSAMKWQPKKDITAKLQAQVANEPEGIWNAKDETLAIPANNFLQTNQEVTDYVVDNLFQRASVNMFMGPPKAGKSTLLRRLALDVAFGLPFLGNWPTKPTRVLYYTLQENKPHLRSWLLQALHGEGYYENEQLLVQNIPIDFVFRIGHRGERVITAMRERIMENNYGLVIIDMLGRFAGVESFDDYAENEKMTDAINSVAQDTNTCIIWSHHEKKSSTGFDGAIGSQSIRGAVYTTLRNWKEKGRYYIATEQRDGEDISATLINYNKENQKMYLSASHIGVALTDAIESKQKIKGLLSLNPSMTPEEMAPMLSLKVYETKTLYNQIKKEQSA